MDFEGYVRILKYHADNQILSNMILKKTPIEFFDFMNSIPYKSQVFEDVSRNPENIFKYGGDCGEKTKCCIIYFKQNGIDYNINFQKVRENKFHVFPAMIKDGIEYPFDTTYGVLKIGEIFNYQIVYRHGK
jgi:hypothetical protein